MVIGGSRLLGYFKGYFTMVLRRIKLEVGNRPTGKAITFAYKHGKNLFFIIPTYQLSVFGTDD